MTKLKADAPLRIVGLGGTLRTNSRSGWALEKGLAVAADLGMNTTLLTINDLQLPFYQPGQPRSEYPQAVQYFLDTVANADAMLWSTGAYHGTLAGATKNALDFIEFLGSDGYLDGVPIGLIATSGGQMAAVNAIDAMVHTAHALRATVLPLKVPIGNARSVFSSEGELLDRGVARRLEMQAKLLVETAVSLARPPIEI